MVRLRIQRTSKRATHEARTAPEVHDAGFAGIDGARRTIPAVRVTRDLLRLAEKNSISTSFSLPSRNASSSRTEFGRGRSPTRRDVITGSVSGSTMTRSSNGLFGKPRRACRHRRSPMKNEVYEAVRACAAFLSKNKPMNYAAGETPLRSLHLDEQQCIERRKAVTRPPKMKWNEKKRRRHLSAALSVPTATQKYRCLRRNTNGDRCAR